MDVKKWRETLQEAVEEGLLVLGEPGKKAVIFHLENTFKIRIENASNDIREFIDALKSIFGLGASFLEQIILERFCKKIGLENAPDLTLEKVIEKLNDSRGEQN